MGSVNGDSGYNVYAGGIAGMAMNSKLSNLYNVGTVNAVARKQADIGGVAGWSYEEQILNVYNYGKININVTEYLEDGEYFLGGITGKNWAGKLTNTFNIGTIETNGFTNGILGGIIGEANSKSTQYENCVYLKETCNQGTGSGNINGITEAENISDIPDILEIINGDNKFKKTANSKYPILNWEKN